MTKAFTLRPLQLTAAALTIVGFVTLRVTQMIAMLPLPSAEETVVRSQAVGGTQALPDVAIETADGTRTSFAATSGHVRIATMFYAHCPGVCPLTIDTLRNIEAQLTPQERARLNFVLLSLDPVRDTPESLRSLARERGIASPRWLVGRTSEADTRTFASASHIQYRTLSDGSIDHSTALTLLDARGHLLARSIEDNDTQEFVAAVRQALAGREALAGPR